MGIAIGNSFEVIEAIDTLKGEGPEDLTELCLVLGSKMIVAGGKAETIDEARDNAEGGHRKMVRHLNYSVN